MVYVASYAFIYRMSIKDRLEGWAHQNVGMVPDLSPELILLLRHSFDLLFLPFNEFHQLFLLLVINALFL